MEHQSLYSPGLAKLVEKALQGSRNLAWDEKEALCHDQDFISHIDEIILESRTKIALHVGAPTYTLQPLPLCTEGMLQAAMAEAGPLVEEIRRCTDEMEGLPPDEERSEGRRSYLQDRIDWLKKRLPAVAFMADFKGKPRKAENATPTGLVLIDIDHMEADPREVYEQRLAPRREELGIVFAQISARGHGLHLVLKGVSDMPIATQQALFAQATGWEIDASCKDLSRLCFMTRREDVLCLDWEGMKEGYFTDVPEVYKADISEKLKTNSEKFPDGSELPAADTDLGTLYEAYFQEHGFPVQGKRNNKVFAATCCLRYASNDAFALKQAVMPFANGLPEREVEQAIRSALSQSDNDANRGELLKLQRELTEPVDEEEEKPNSIEQEWEALEQNLPWLPPVIKQEVARIPAPLKPAAICACLPILGALTTNVQAKYRNTEIHTTSFQVIVEGKSGFCKSTMTTPIKESLWEVQQQYEDREREKQERHNEELQKSNGAKEIKSKADFAPRDVPPRSSVSAIYRYLKNNKGRHLLMYAPEISDITGSAARAFSDKTVLFRQAFGNEEYGQDYISPNSPSGKIKVYLNTLFLGTRGDVDAYINGRNSANGVAHRIIFTRTPDCDEEIKPLPEEDHQFILRYLRGFCEKTGSADKPLERINIELEWLKEEMGLWCKEQKMIGAATLVDQREELSHRAGSIGFRAGLLAMALLGLEREEQLDEKLKANISEWAHWVANYTLRGQLLHGVGAKDEKEELRQRAPKPQPQLFKMLPQEFTIVDIKNACKKLRTTHKADDIAYKWRKAGLIERVRKGVYRKIG